MIQEALGVEGMTAREDVKLTSRSRKKKISAGLVRKGEKERVRQSVHGDTYGCVI